jgi:hypothetical protein
MRRISRRLGVAGGLATFLVIVGVAFAAFHTVNGFQHGIQDMDWGIYRSWINDTDSVPSNSTVSAGLYHLRSTGSWETLCTNFVRIGVAYCDGPRGNLPCQKYAWTEGQDPGGTVGWHGMRPAFC